MEWSVGGSPTDCAMDDRFIDNASSLAKRHNLTVQDTSFSGTEDVHRWIQVVGSLEVLEDLKRILYRRD